MHPLQYELEQAHHARSQQIAEHERQVAQAEQQLGPVRASQGRLQVLLTRLRLPRVIQRGMRQAASR